MTALNTREAFMAAFRSEELHEQLTVDDCHEIFKDIMKGESDFTPALIEDLKGSYGGAVLETCSRALSQPSAFIFHLSNNNGDHYSLHASEASAELALATYISSDYDDDANLALELRKRMGKTIYDATNKELIAAWSDYMDDEGDEFAHIENLTIEGQE